MLTGGRVGIVSILLGCVRSVLRRAKVFAYNKICLYVFIIKSHFEFTIVEVYVDNINLNGTPKEPEKIVAHLKSKFEIKKF